MIYTIELILTIDMTIALMFLKDFLRPTNTRFFLCEADGLLSEKSATEILDIDRRLVCHDYWLIARDLYIAAGKDQLPKNVVDLQEYQISISGSTDLRRTRDQRNVEDLLSDCGTSSDVLKKYRQMIFRSEPFDDALLKAIGPALIKCWEMLHKVACDNLENDRQEEVELPAANYLTLSAARGIAINTAELRAHKEQMEHQYFSALKTFSAKYDFPLEVPTNDDIVEYLEPKGFDFSEVDVEYILRFISTPDDFGKDVLMLRKLAQSRRVLAAIPLSQNRIFPIVEPFGSITSRIYFKDPSLQNLSKRHRSIISSDPDQKLSYIDYDQYEVGIMAALSNDGGLLSLYSKGDLYEAIAKDIFGDEGKRRDAKRLFLSYAYGMRLENLVSAAVELGGNRASAKAYFKKFHTFEEWKETVRLNYFEAGCIGTTLGNFRRRTNTGPLTPKERRSAVSQVVQGTASLIFKKALLAISNEPVELKIPMHDAILIQHQSSYDINRVVELMSSVMSDHFGGAIKGKASVDTFA